MSHASHSARRHGPARPRLLAGLAALVALLALACGGGDGFKIERAESTETPVAAATPDGGDPEPAPAATPEGPSPIPEAPADLLRGSDEIVDYLNGGIVDLAGCLPELVAAWGFSPIDGPRCTLINLDDDEADEFVLVITTDGGEPAPENRRGDVWFFDDASANYRIFASARALANRQLTGVAIRSFADLTDDGAPDLAITFETCGGATCTTDLLIVTAHRGRLENLAPTSIAMPGLESFAVETAGETPQVLMRGGTVESDSAGPQRTITRTIRWSGFSFISEDEFDEPQYLIHLIADADEAFKDSDYALARALYERAARDRTIADWKAELGAPPARPELASYALFRAALASQRLGDGVTTLSLLDRSFRDYPTTMHGTGALLFKVELDKGSSTTVACAEVELYLAGFAAIYIEFWDYGTANPAHAINTLCR